MKVYRIFAVNPGSTSTKIALFENDDCVFKKNVAHSAEELAKFPEISDQLDYRLALILEELEKAGVSIEGADAIVGRGGGFHTMEGGTYRINERMLTDGRIGVAAQHPSNLGCQLAEKLAQRFGGQTFVVNGPTTDEFDEIARVSGFAGVYRQSIIHALNQKEVGIRYANAIGKKYEDIDLVIAHIGGGISVTAHRRGRMVDSNDIINGDGPMAPTRAGSISAVDMLRLSFSGKYTEREIYQRINKVGGLVDHLGTADALEIKERIENGDAYAKLVYDAMIYQVGKNIGAYAAVLRGELSGIVLTGGLVNDDYLVTALKEMIGFLGPVAAMPGEFEMEALASGALRVLTGEEEAREYTGRPVWNGFDHYIK